MVTRMRKNRRHRRAPSGTNRKTPWLAGDIVVWSQRGGGHCVQCGAQFGNKRCLTVACGEERKGGRRCLACANLTSLAFLPAGDARLTRRASMHSARRAVVVRKRGKYVERCGILVAPTAILQACDEYAVEVPAACFKRIAGSKTILPPDPPIALRPAKRAQPPGARPTAQPSPPAGRTNRPAPCAQPPAAPGRYTEKQIAKLIRAAFPDCHATRASEVARFALNHPDAEQLLQNLGAPGRIGLLVSRYLRRRHVDTRFD